MGKKRNRVGKEATPRSQKITGVALWAQLDKEGEMEAWALFRGTLQCNNVIEITSSPLGSRADS